MASSRSRSRSRSCDSVSRADVENDVWAMAMEDLVPSHTLRPQQVEEVKALLVEISECANARSEDFHAYVSQA